MISVLKPTFELYFKEAFEQQMISSCGRSLIKLATFWISNLTRNSGNWLNLSDFSPLSQWNLPQITLYNLIDTQPDFVISLSNP